MYWIPSHSDISGNDIVDTLAKSKTSSTTIDIPTIPFSDFNEIFKKIAFSNTEKHIKESAIIKGKKYFKYFYSYSSKPWFSRFKNLP